MMDSSLAVDPAFCGTGIPAREKMHKLYTEYPMKGVTEIFAFRRLSEKQKKLTPCTLRAQATSGSGCEIMILNNPKAVQSRF